MIIISSRNNYYYNTATTTTTTTSTFLLLAVVAAIVLVLSISTTYSLLLLVPQSVLHNRNKIFNRHGLELQLLPLSFTTGTGRQQQRASANTITTTLLSATTTIKMAIVKPTTQVIADDENDDNDDDNDTDESDAQQKQFLLSLKVWQRQIRLCGNHVTQAVQLLRHIITTHNNNVTTNNNSNYHNTTNDNVLKFESLYLETLAVIGRAKRSNPKSIRALLLHNNNTTTSPTMSDQHHQKHVDSNDDNDDDPRCCTIEVESLDHHPPIQQLAIQLYMECHTESCRARTISICNTAPCSTLEQQQQILTIAIQLLQYDGRSNGRNNNSASNDPTRRTTPPPGIQSYHAVLAACAIAKDYERAQEIVAQMEVLSSNNNNNNNTPSSKNTAMSLMKPPTVVVITTLTYNLLFTTLFRAKRGYTAYTLLQQMIMYQQQQQTIATTIQHSNNNNTDELSLMDISGNHTGTTKYLPPPDLNTFHLTIKALIATTTKEPKENFETTMHVTGGSNSSNRSNIDIAYSLLNSMMELDDWYHQTSTGTPVRPNAMTFDLLITAYSRCRSSGGGGGGGGAAWENVKFIETIQSQYNTYYCSGGDNEHQRTVFTFPPLPPNSCNGVSISDDTTIIKTVTDRDHVPSDDDNRLPSGVAATTATTTTPIASSYFSSSMRIQWENVGMTKFKNEKYWTIATYNDPQRKFIVALQPHRNPIKNGIKLLLYNVVDQHDNDSSSKNTTTVTTKVGYLLMINHPMSNNNRNSVDCTSDVANVTNQNSLLMNGTSTLLGVYLDPLYRQGGLSKVIIAIWLQLCHKAHAIPRTGVMNKPLLVLVLQHTFHFLPEATTTGNNGVSVEISLVTNNATTTTTSLSSSTSSSATPSAIGIYSSNIRCLQGVFSLRDVRRENIIVLREPATPHRGRLCQLGATFVIPSNMATTTNHADVVQQQILGKSQHGKLEYSAIELCWTEIFFGFNKR